jgi:hypothetical protein
LFLFLCCRLGWFSLLKWAVGFFVDSLRNFSEDPGEDDCTNNLQFGFFLGKVSVLIGRGTLAYEKIR